MKVGIVRFAGTNCEQDIEYCYRELLGCSTEYIWHRDTTLPSVDLIVLPGGFSFGDYLRCGALARLSPIMSEVINFAERGGGVIGICNGFQILCEVGLLPGVLLQNESMRFVSRFVPVQIESDSSILTYGQQIGAVFDVPLAHFDGRYYLDQPELEQLESRGQVILRYVERQGFPPNGAVNQIAGVRNESGNVVGLMPHPERFCEAILSPGALDSSPCLNLLRASLLWVENRGERAVGTPVEQLA